MTSTDIVNQALAKIGGQLITNLEDEPRHAMAYKSALGEFLEDHDWNWATIGPLGLAAVPVTAPKPTNFDHCYALPGDFLRRVTVATDRDELRPLEYRIQGPNIWTNTHSLQLTYITSDPPALTFATPSIHEALATLVAEKLARTLLQSPETASALRGEYESLAKPKAKKNDLQNNPGSGHIEHRHPYATSRLIQSRRYGHRRHPDHLDIDYS